MKIVTLEDQGIDRVTGQCEFVMEAPGRALHPRTPKWRRQCPNRATVRATSGKRYCRQHAPASTLSKAG